MDESPKHSENKPLLSGMLKNLPKVKAAPGFEMRLQKRLNEQMGNQGKSFHAGWFPFPVRVPVFATSILAMFAVSVISYFVFKESGLNTMSPQERPAVFLPDSAGEKTRPLIDTPEEKEETQEIQAQPALQQENASLQSSPVTEREKNITTSSRDNREENQNVQKSQERIVVKKESAPLFSSPMNDKKVDSKESFSTPVGKASVPNVEKDADEIQMKIEEPMTRPAQEINPSFLRGGRSNESKSVQTDVPASANEFQYVPKVQPTESSGLRKMKSIMSAPVNPGYLLQKMNIDSVRLDSLRKDSLRLDSIKRKLQKKYQ